MEAHERVLAACHALVNGSGELKYFEQRGITEKTVREARIGYEAGAFTYPCFTKDGGLLGVHRKSKTRNVEGKRKQWWTHHAEDLSPKGHGKKPEDPAKVVPFGLETLKDLGPGSLDVRRRGRTKPETSGIRGDIATRRGPPRASLCPRT